VHPQWSSSFYFGYSTIPAHGSVPYMFVGHQQYMLVMCHSPNGHVRSDAAFFRPVLHGFVSILMISSINVNFKNYYMNVYSMGLSLDLVETISKCADFLCCYTHTEAGQNLANYWSKKRRLWMHIPQKPSVQIPRLTS